MSSYPRKWSLVLLTEPVLLLKSIVGVLFQELLNKTKVQKETPRQEE